MLQFPLFPHNIPVSWSVTDLTRYMRGLLESDELLQDVWVTGEVSNFKRHTSGHLYFTIKDERASLRCVMWRGMANLQRFMPREGDAVEVHGKITVYEVRGEYQLESDHFRPAGEGALYQEFLRLKSLLEAEGLFDPERKRPLPAMPKRIGIITSSTGAALQDMLKTLHRRFPLVEVVLADTLVQGDGAPPKIIAALQDIARLASPDVIILARGGGSIEDLWAFNDEKVARAIAACPMPVITGIGHETDFTIADFVADLRAPTPTSAAEQCVPNQADLRMDLDELSQTLDRLIQAYYSEISWSFKELQNLLDRNSPRMQIQSGVQHVVGLYRRLGAAMQYSLQLANTHLSGLEQHLKALSPAAVLERGYAIVTNQAGEAISRVEQVNDGEALNVQVSDGEFKVHVVDA